MKMGMYCLNGTVLPSRNSFLSFGPVHGDIRARFWTISVEVSCSKSDGLISRECHPPPAAIFSNSRPLVAFSCYYYYYYFPQSYNNILYHQESFEMGSDAAAPGSSECGFLLTHRLVSSRVRSLLTYCAVQLQHCRDNQTRHGAEFSLSKDHRSLTESN
jgi:hypothetical protein